MEQTTRPPVADLFALHRARVYNFCLRMVAHPQTAEDLTQEIFLKALERPERADAPWLYAVARNHCIDFLRRQKSWQAAWSRLLGWTGPAAREGYRVDDALLDRHLGMSVLQRMTPRQRALLILKNYVGLSYQEMAAALGTTPQSVGPMLTRARGEAAAIVEKEGMRDGL